jgi:hypothetical protein
MKNIFQKLHTLLRNCSEAIQRPIINYRQHRQWKREREERGYTCLTCHLHDSEYETCLNKKFGHSR